MGTIISVLIIIVCVLLILVVLVQNSKGGGLASSFASSNQVMGVRKTADFLEKATWTLAAALLVLSVISTSFTKTSGVTTGAGVESTTRKMSAEDVTPAVPANNAAPVAPAPASGTPTPN
ncbi:MAG: preprotein translocase subunit SecG [Bacteroidetes bacterium]|nr:preprotein translocase subunit SecG [Bacteroidota bacterium]